MHLPLEDAFAGSPFTHIISITTCALHSHIITAPPTPCRANCTVIATPTRPLPQHSMADYAKKKNDELAALCKERSLPHTGKKADLVKRLEDYDAKGASASASAPAKPAANEDEIDWDDEAKAATTEPAAAAIAAGGVGEVANPLAVPNQQASTLR